MLGGHADQWTLTACDKASVALAALAQHRYDAVIADWYLADSTGLTFLNHVSEQNPSTVTVILFNVEEDSLKCIGAPHQLLGKPYDESGLVSALEHACDASAWLPNEAVRKLVVGMKNVTMNEPFFVGHFPNEPLMPGVLLIEAMAQVGGIFVLSFVPDPEHYITYFLKIDKVKFRQKVVPGDTVDANLRYRMGDGYNEFSVAISLAISTA